MSGPNASSFAGSTGTVVMGAFKILVNMVVSVHTQVDRILFIGRSEISCPGCHEKWSHDIPDIDLPVTSDPSVNTSTIQSGHGYNEAPPSKRPRRR